MRRKVIFNHIINTRRDRVKYGVWEPAGSRTVNVKDIIPWVGRGLLARVLLVTYWRSHSESHASEKLLLNRKETHVNSWC
jgi:hypothetical protein